jgi:hypothetical protein
MGGDEVGELLKNIYASPPEVINLASQLIRKSP